jgi:hypothetical protein
MGPSGLIVVILLDRRRFRVRTFLAIGFKISTLYLFLNGYFGNGLGGLQRWNS